MRLTREILDRRDLREDHGFFRVGGDSISALQLVARARRFGVGLTLEQVFASETLGALGRSASLVAKSAGGRVEPASGPSPLTPIQHWFFSRPWANRNHWSLTMAVELVQPVSDARLRDAVEALLERHPVLRSRFISQNGTWTQEIPPSVAGGPEGAHLRCLALAGPYARSEPAILDALVEAQGELDIANGDLLRAVLFRDADGQQLLVLAVHHLVIDAISLRALAEDLSMLCADRSLDPVGTSFRAWALALHERAVAEHAFDGSIPYWSSVAAGSPAAAPEPQARSRGERDGVEHAVHTAVVSRDVTAALLTDASDAYDTRVNDLLLAALGRALARWSGESESVVDVEGHGRESLVSGVDVSRTVGWFTSLFPVRLRDATDLRELVVGTKRVLADTPHRGADHGILRYLRRIDAVVPPADPRIQFNYLGHWDGFAVPGLLRAADATLVGSLDRASSDADNPKPHPIEVEARVTHEILRIDWHFDGGRVDRAAVEELARHYTEALQEIVAHCVSAAQWRTPADYPLATIEQHELSALVRRVGRAPEDLHPLAPVQEAILFHHLMEEDDVYPVQIWMEVDGPLDPTLSRRAWSLVAERHPALRSGFDWSCASGPLQYVTGQDATEWEVVEAHAIPLEALLARDRRRFDLEAPSPVRLSIWRRSRTSSVLVWTYHHILLDGWCESELLQQWLDAYACLARGERPEERLRRSRAVPRDYVEWLRSQDHGRLEAFWRDYLRGATPCHLGRRVSASGPDSHGHFEAHLGEELSDAIRQHAASAGVTLTTLFQRAWAELLRRRTGNEAPMFGLAVSGRAIDLEGIEDMMTALVSVVPCQVPCTPISASSLRELQARNAPLQSHAHLSLAKIQALAGNAGTSWFDTTLTVENFRVAHDMANAAGLRVSDLRWHERAEVALMVDVLPEPNVLLDLSFRRPQLELEEVEGIFTQVTSILREIASGSPATKSTRSASRALESHEPWKQSSIERPTSHG